MSNDLEDTALLPSFIAYLREQYATIVETISNQLHQQQVGPYQGMSLEQVQARVIEGLNPYFQALTENNGAPLSQRLNNVLQPALIQHMPIEALLQVVAIYRTAMLAVGMEAVLAKVEGSARGVQRLMALFDQAVLAIGRAYQPQLHLFQTLAEYAPDGIGVADLEGNIRYANPTMRAQIDYGDEIIGTSVAALIAPEDHPKLAELRATLRSGKS